MSRNYQKVRVMYLVKFVTTLRVKVHVKGTQKQQLLGWESLGLTGLTSTSKRECVFTLLFQQIERNHKE